MWAKPDKAKVVGKSLADKEILPFATQAKWRAWLLRHSHKSDGIWLKFFKKASGVKTITYAEALDEALCFGWIDSQVAKFDDQAYLQKFTPRRSKSLWSKRNRDHVVRLIKEKKMTPAGLTEIKRAKTDGRWEAAYDSPSVATLPADFLSAIDKNKKAAKFFKTLNKINRYAITWRLQTAKTPATRAKRLAQIVAMLAEEKKFH